MHQTLCIGFAGAESTTYHCTRICKDVNVVVVAPSYRLAPEHRLPTAYNDGITTLLWLQKQVRKHAIIKHNLNHILFIRNQQNSV